MLEQNDRSADGVAEAPIGEADPVGLDELRRRSGVRLAACVRCGRDCGVCRRRVLGECLARDLATLEKLPDGMLRLTDRAGLQFSEIDCVVWAIGRVPNLAKLAPDQTVPIVVIGKYRRSRAGSTCVRDRL